VTTIAIATIIVILNNKKASIRWQDSAPPHASNGGRSLCVLISRERSYPLPIYWYHLKTNWLRYNFAADSFYIMKLFSRLLVLYCRNCMKDDKFKYLIPILRKLGTLVEARWKARVDFLLIVTELFLSLTVDALQGKTCQNLLLFWRGWVSLSQDFKGNGSSLGNILGR